MGYEVIRGGQGYSTAFPEKGDIILRKVTSKGGGRSSKSVSTTPTVSLQAGTVFINGQGYSVAPSLMESFIKSKGGVVTSSIQQQIIAQKKAQEEAQKRATFLKQQAKQEAQKELQRVLTARITQENKLKQDIAKLEQQRRDVARQSISEAEYKKILNEKKQKQNELYELRSGVTAYNKKVDVLVNNAQRELDNYINKELSKLQSEVDSGSRSVESANVILENKIQVKTSEINKNLNNDISKIPVPSALKVPVKSVESVEIPKNILEKIERNLSKIPTKKYVKGEELKNQLRGLEEIGIGVAISSIGFLKGSYDIAKLGRDLKIDYTKLIPNIVKKPSLIKTIPKQVVKYINEIPYKQLIKGQGEMIGLSLKISPTRTLAKIGTEVYFLIGGSGYFKDIEFVPEVNKLKSLSKLEEAGKLGRIEVKLVTGKKPKIQIRIKNISEVIKPVSSTRNIKYITKDFLKLIPKTVSKIEVGKLVPRIEEVVREFLNSEKIIRELIRRYPGRKSFSLKEIKKLTSYPKLKARIKSEVFGKANIKVLRAQVIRTPSRFSKEVILERKIGGVKVPKKEFATYLSANKEYQKFKKSIGKFVKKIDNKGGAGIVETLPKKAITKKEIELSEIGRKIPKQFLKDVTSVQTTTFTQKFFVRVPIIKRFGSLKNGFWRMVFKDIEFYQNSVSFSLFNKRGNSIGTFTFNSLSSKPITKFRSLTNALKWGRNKSIVFSKSTGKDFVRSFVLKSRSNKISKTEFLSKVKISSSGKLEEITIQTKKIPKFTTRTNIKKQFETSIPISLTKGRITKSSPIEIIKKRGRLEILKEGKVVKKIMTKSIINPVVIDTSRIDNIIRELNKLKVESFSYAKIKRMKQLNKIIKRYKKYKSFTLQGKEKLIIPESQIKQLNKISQETKALKESLSGKSITPKFKLTKRVEGIKELRKLKRIEKEIKSLRIKLIKKGILDIASKTAILQTLRLLNKFKQDLKQGQIVVTDQLTKSLQSQIQSSLQKSKSKSVLKTIKLLKEIYPTLIFDISTRNITPKVPESRKPIIPIKKKKRLIKDIKILSSPRKIYDVVVKKGGRNYIIKDKLIEEDALDFMAYELDTKLLRSSVLKPIGLSKIVRKLPTKYKGAYNERKQKLRQYKIKMKNKIPIKGYIEKRKYALDTKTEREQLKKAKRKISPTQRRILLQRLKKARAVRMRKLRRKR